MEVARPVDDGRARAWLEGGGRLWLTLGPAALLAGLAAAAIVLTGRDSREALAVILPVGWMFVAAGLIAWTRQPENRVGRLLVATGFAWFLAALSLSDVDVLFTLGLLLFATAYAVLIHLLLAYPTGRLGGRADVAVVALAYLDATVLQLPWLVFQPFPNPDCEDCPENVLLVADRPLAAGIASGVTTVIAIGLVVYVAVSFVRRWRSASPRGRRALAPVLAAGGGFLLALAVQLLLDPVWSTGTVVVQWVGFAFLLLVPVAFLAGLLRSRIATAGAGRSLLVAAPTASREEAQEGLRRALGDPTLELAFWLPERGAYVDVAGKPFALPPDGAGRMTTPIAYEGDPVAALVHDESLRHEPELVSAAVAATRVALERERLQAELRARLDELQRERDFVATVVETAPGLFCVVDLEGRIIRFNTTGEAITGRTDDDRVRGLHFWEVFVASRGPEELRGRLLAAAAAGGSPETETEIVAAGGVRRTLAWSSTPIVDAQGVRRLLISGVDVTERREQALELERERDFGHAVTDTTPSFLVVVDDMGRITEGGVNKACEDAVGRSEAELIGQRFVHAFIPPEERAAVIEKLGEAGGGAPVEHEGPWLGRDGRELWVSWSCRPLRGEGVRRSFLVCGTDVTERRRHELVLQREHDTLNTIANTAPSFLLIVDGQGRFSDEGVNAAASRVLGYSEEEIAHRDFVDLVVAPEDRAVTRELFLASVATGKPVEADAFWTTRSGERLRVAWSSTWLARGDDGEREFYLVCGTDVTERERQAQELQRQRDALTTIANAAPSFMAVVDEHGRCAQLALNAAFERVLGYTDAEASGRDLLDLVLASEDLDEARATFERSVAERRPIELDSTWLTRTGERLRVAWSATWVASADGSERYLVCGTDVTERERHAAAIQRERDFLVTLGDAATSFLIVVHANGILVDEALNDAAGRALEYADDEADGRDFVELLVAPEHRAAARAHLARAVAAGEMRELDSVWLTKGGDPRLVAWSVRRLGPVLDEHETLYLVSGTDLTERKRQEDELRASRARIVEAADAERRRLERNLHDGAQQRLVTLSLTLRLAESRLGTDAEAVALLQGARDELGQALDELRDLARGIHPAVLSDHGLSAALDALASRVPLPVEIRRGLPVRLPEPVEVAVYYVVSESLANVQKYAGATYVEIGVEHQNGHAVVEVRDDGVGGADVTGGSGLRGLADRVEALGGRLEIESLTGSGTTVRAHIPVA